MLSAVFVTSKVVVDENTSIPPGKKLIILLTETDNRFDNDPNNVKLVISLKS